MKKKIGTITFNFLEHDAVSKNGRCYPAATVKEMVRQARADLAAGQILSCFATHDYALAENATNMIGKIEDIWEEGTVVKGRVGLFDTSIARDFAGVVAGEGIKTVSLRASEFKMSPNLVTIGGVQMEAVGKARLAGVDFAMRPGIDMAQLQSYAFESTHPNDHTTRDVVPCATEAYVAPVVALLEDEGKVMDPEEIKRLAAEEARRIIAEAQAADKAAAAALEAKRHAHPHDHMGGDKKKYTHEHKHAHSDDANTDHDHEHGNPYELDAFPLKVLADHLVTRGTAYMAEGDKLEESAAQAIKDVSGSLAPFVAGLQKTGIMAIDSAAKSEEHAKVETALTESQTALTEAGTKLAATETTVESLRASVTALSEAKAALEVQLSTSLTEKAAIAKALIEAQKPSGRHVPVNQIMEQAAEIMGLDLDAEIPDGPVSKRVLEDMYSGWGAAIVNAGTAE